MHCIIVDATGGVEGKTSPGFSEFGTLMAARADRRGAGAVPPACRPRRAHTRIRNAATVRFSDVTKADLIKLELDHVRQLANGRYADEHDRQGPELLPLCGGG